MRHILLLVIAIAFLLFACSAPEAAVELAATLTPGPVPTITSAPPTPSDLGQTVEYDKYQVTMDRVEFTQEYTNEYGIVQNPPVGRKYLWVHVSIRNTGDKILKIPRADRFGVLYHDAELKTSYGHRQDYPDYTSLETQILPDQTAEAWMRFETPEASELPELVFAFSPESNRVSLNTPNRGPWSEHPVYLWNLTP